MKNRLFSPFIYKDKFYRNVFNCIYYKTLKNYDLRFHPEPNELYSVLLKKYKFEKTKQFFINLYKETNIKRISDNEGLMNEILPDITILDEWYNEVFRDNETRANEKIIKLGYKAYCILNILINKGNDIEEYLDSNFIEIINDNKELSKSLCIDKDKEIDKYLKVDNQKYLPRKLRFDRRVYIQENLKKKEEKKCIFNYVKSFVQKKYVIKSFPHEYESEIYDFIKNMDREMYSIILKQKCDNIIVKDIELKVDKLEETTDDLYLYMNEDDLILDENSYVDINDKYFYNDENKKLMDHYDEYYENVLDDFDTILKKNAEKYLKIKFENDLQLQYDISKINFSDLKFSSIIGKIKKNYHLIFNNQLHKTCKGDKNLDDLFKKFKKIKGIMTDFDYRLINDFIYCKYNTHNKLLFDTKNIDSGYFICQSDPNDITLEKYRKDFYRSYKSFNFLF